MGDKPFKAFEREVAKLIGGTRFPANSGAELDCEGPTIVAQCKLVSRLSLEELTQLAETAAAQGQAKGKIGLVGVKVRRGAGHPSPGLVVMTFEQFKKIAPTKSELAEVMRFHEAIQMGEGALIERRAKESIKSTLAVVRESHS